MYFPEYRPRAASLDSAGSRSGGLDGRPPAHLATFLQSLHRPADQVDFAHLEALGVHVNPDSQLSDLIPDPSCLPDFDKWDTLSREDAHAIAPESQPKLCNDRLAPGPAKYVDVRQGLLTENDRAFRAVRRVAPRSGEQYVRLGYCHEFFRHLEVLTGFWVDSSINNSPTRPEETPADGNETKDKTIQQDDNWKIYRTSAGSAMPAQYRTQILTSFLKLVTYDFSCNVMSRQEPRLYIKSATLTKSTTSTDPSPRHSYFSSGCNFIFRMPLDRESAKYGIVEGPIAAVSPRHTLLFPPIGRERESVIDLSREIIAALITAQHRAREGKHEERIGRDVWWATKRRWGGGTGGPIGREAEVLESTDSTPALIEGKDERPGAKANFVEGEGISSAKNVSSPGAPSSLPTGSRRSFKTSFGHGATASGSASAGGSSPPQSPNPKRPRKSLPAYDAYRMVRPPSMHWDPKTRYAAIGRQRGTGYDDVFVISSLFHHISILRVRVPNRLLEVLGGDAPDPGVQGRGKLEIWRTRWYDFFVAQDRVEAMKAVWGVVAYAMRSTSAEHDEMELDGDGDGRRAAADADGKKGNPRR